MDHLIIHLPYPPTSTRWAFVRSDNGRMYYRSHNGRLYFQDLRTGTWYRIQNQTKEK